MYGGLNTSFWEPSAFLTESLTGRQNSDAIFSRDSVLGLQAEPTSAANRPVSSARQCDRRRCQSSEWTKWSLVCSDESPSGHRNVIISDSHPQVVRSSLAEILSKNIELNTQNICVWGTPVGDREFFLAEYVLSGQVSSRSIGVITLHHTPKVRTRARRCRRTGNKLIFVNKCWSVGEGSYARERKRIWVWDFRIGAKFCRGLVVPTSWGGGG